MCLLENARDEELHEAASASGSLRYVSVHEVARLFRAGYPQYEQRLCDCVYANWRESATPEVRDAINALGSHGNRDGLDTLEAILPDLADLEVTERLALGRAEPAGHVEDQRKLAMRALEYPVFAKRLEQVRDAIGLIKARLER